jgi:hypothetical protein
MDPCLETIKDQASKRHFWNKQLAEKICKEYIKFLEIRAKHPNCSPSDKIDQFWHTHILNVKNYVDYCNKKFGHIIDHNPKDADDQGERQVRIQRSIDIYRKNFGDPPTEVWGIIAGVKGKKFDPAKDFRIIIHDADNKRWHNRSILVPIASLRIKYKNTYYSGSVIEQNIKTTVDKLVNKGWYAMKVLYSNQPNTAIVEVEQWDDMMFVDNNGGKHYKYC